MPIIICLLIIIGLSSWSTSYAKPVNCSVHKLYCKIVKLRPSINKKWAMRYSNLLYSLGKKYKMDPWRSLAIAMQESSIQNIHRRQKVIVFTKRCRKGRCSNHYKIVKGYSDLGLYQFHVDTIEQYKIDPFRLKKDLRYVIEMHFRILRNKIKMCRKLKADAWTCYHSKTRYYRKQYKKLVNRYYFKNGRDKRNRSRKRR